MRISSERCLWRVPCHAGVPLVLLLALSGYGMPFLMAAADDARQPQKTPLEEAASSVISWRIERLDPRLDAIVSPAVDSASMQLIGSGFSWAEGPVWDAGEQRLFFSDVPNNVVYVWYADSQSAGANTVVEYLRPSGHTGYGEPANSKHEGANGLALTDDGTLVLCQHGDRRVAQVLPEGGFKTLASHYDGRRLNSPNDITRGPTNSWYFTDPTFGLPRNRKSPLREQPHTGVYRLDAGGRLRLMVDDIFPNGIAFSHDFKWCYIANQRYLMRYAVDMQGQLLQPMVFAELHADIHGAWDGLAVDAGGNIFACNYVGSIAIFAPDGAHLGTIHCGNKTANCCLGGNDERILFITAQNRVLALHLDGFTPAP